MAGWPISFDGAVNKIVRITNNHYPLVGRGRTRAIVANPVLFYVTGSYVGDTSSVGARSGGLLGGSPGQHTVLQDLRALPFSTGYPHHRPRLGLLGR